MQEEGSASHDGASSSADDGDVDDAAARTSSLTGKRVTILSIDGGGIRGLIPCKILEFLEQQLQILDGSNARIADYFDVIAGTSTGGIIASLLTIPDEKSRPRFKVQDATNIYIRDGPKIFPRQLNIPFISQLLGPKYKPNGLEKLLQETCKDLRIRDTLSDLVIPTFDIKEMEPTYFSTCEAKRDDSKNAFLRDVLRGTTAAPTYFPPTSFFTISAARGRRAFNLVDGGVGINNPTYHAIVHVQREIFHNNPVFAERVIAKAGFKSLLVLSLGTGNVSESYDYNQVASWGALSWIFNNGKAPLLDMVAEASANVVDYNISVLFHTLECPDNYLRIQALDLSGDVTAIDNVTKENLTRLENIGAELLETHVKIPDMDTGKYVSHLHRGKNKQALKRFAKELVGECQARRCLLDKKT